MINSNIAKFLLAGAALFALSGCGLASLPGGYSPIEQQTVQELNTANYTPRSADQRAAILTQDLFAQAAFWSREYDLNPADLEAALNLSSALRHLGNPHKAIEVAQTTRALYPRDVDLMAELAAAQLADNNPKDALPIIDTALGQRPDKARLWSLKGAALDQFEQYTEARQQYSRALAIAPNDPGIIANVGLSYALEGDPKTAEVWLRRAANMPGASANVRQNLSLVLGLQNKFDEAEKWAGRDLDAQSTANNMSYIRTLRGASSPITNVQNPVGTTVYGTQQSAPSTSSANPNAPKNYAPKTYGTPTASYQRPAALPKAHAPNQAYKQAQYPYPGARLKMATGLTNAQNGPKTSREAALAMARQASTQNITNPQGRPPINMRVPNQQQSRTSAKTGPQVQPQRPTTPVQNGQDILGRISQNNLPKTVIARRQQQELASRAQMQYQAQQQLQQQGQGQGQPYPYPPQNYPAPMYAAQPGYAQPGQMAPASDIRAPARQRRR